MFEFEGFAKIPRLSREIVVTEKLDGTNAQVNILDISVPRPGGDTDPGMAFLVGDYLITAGSRNRYISIGDDNFGFAKWVQANREELAKLGPGRHFGEWWGQGIGRRYGLDEKRFSLFNTHRWTEDRPACCHVVPELYRGPFDLDAIEDCLNKLAQDGSVAAPGFFDPEGVVIYHTAANALFKKTLYNDEAGKGG